jgi:hypothetical protein
MQATILNNDMFSRVAEIVTPMRSAGLVTIIMPVCNGERFVAAAIELALVQTYQAVELVIVNDGSPDGSGREINRFLPHSKIRYVEQQHAGVAPQETRGLQAPQAHLSRC